MFLTCMYWCALYYGIKVIKSCFKWEERLDWAPQDKILAYWPLNAMVKHAAGTFLVTRLYHQCFSGPEARYTMTQ